jgi:hypothetical protein
MLFDNGTSSGTLQTSLTLLFQEVKTDMELAYGGTLSWSIVQTGSYYVYNVNYNSFNELTAQGGLVTLGVNSNFSPWMEIVEEEQEELIEEEDSHEEPCSPTGFVSVEEVIASAKIRLRLMDTSQPDMALEHYIFQGARSLNALDSYTMMQESIDIVDGKAKVPSGFHTFIAARLKNFSDEDNAQECSNVIYANVPFLYKQGCDCSNDSLTSYTNTFQIVGNNIHFNYPVGAETLILVYYGRNLDENGNQCFPEDHSRALIAYACYQYALSYRITQLDPSGYAPDQVEMYRQEWMAQKAWSRGNAVKRDARLRRAEIMSTMNALLTDKTFLS